MTKLGNEVDQTKNYGMNLRKNQTNIFIKSITLQVQYKNQKISNNSMRIFQYILKCFRLNRSRSSLNHNLYLHYHHKKRCIINRMRCKKVIKLCYANNLKLFALFDVA